MRLHLVRVLGKPGQAAAAMIMLRRKGVAQQPIDALPGGQHLRAFDFVRQLPLRIDDLARRDVYAEILGRKTKRAQPLDQFVLRDDARAAPGQLAVHPFENVDIPPGPTQQKPAEQAAHRSPDDYCAFSVGPGQLFSLDLSVYPFILYIKANSFGGIPMALTMLDKQAEKKDK